MIEEYEPEECWWCGRLILTESENVGHAHPACFRAAKGEHDRERQRDDEITDGARKYAKYEKELE